MTFWTRPRIQHPFYPKLAVTAAEQAHGRVAVLAGTYQQLEHAAAAGASVQRAVFITDGAAVTEEQRDRLWDLFRVPAYAMLLDGKGRVAAFECEAQRGFHVPGKAASDSPLCECGRPGRLLYPETATVTTLNTLLPVAA